MFAALIEIDAEGIGGSGFVECIREHIHSVCNIVDSTCIKISAHDWELTYILCVVRVGKVI